MLALSLAVILVAAPATLEVGGDLPKTGALSVKDLQALGVIKVRWSDHDVEQELTGVPLIAILRSLGFDDGPRGKGIAPGDKHAGLRAVVIATAADGYQAVFSAGELLEQFGNAQVLIAWETDGKPLAPELGPFRIVAVSDKQHSRSTYQLKRLELRKLKK